MKSCKVFVLSVVFFIVIFVFCTPFVFAENKTVLRLATLGQKGISATVLTYAGRLEELSEKNKEAISKVLPKLEEEATLAFKSCNERSYNAMLKINP